MCHMLFGTLQSLPERRVFTDTFRVSLNLVIVR
jgi:hypothetical protein